MNPDVSFLLGYGGYAKIKLRNGNCSQPEYQNDEEETYNTVPILTGNYDRSMTVPLQSTFNTKLDNNKGGRIRTGVGVYSFSGQMSFELSDTLRDVIFNSNLNFFARNAFLDLELCDGEGKISIPGAVWNSFDLSGSVGGIINGSISFMSCNSYNEDITVTDFNGEENPIDEESFNLEPYWQYGGEGIQDFQLSLSRSVTPVYLNEKNWIGPSYLRVGLMDASLSVTCWEKWFDHSSIVLGNKTLTFNEGSFQNAKSYQFAGINGEGMKTYTKNAVSMKGDGDLFVIGEI